MSSKNKESKQRKSKYDRNRSCYMDNDGGYVYEVEDLDTHIIRKERFVPKTDEENELVLMLDETDHRWDLQARYEQENMDYEMENKRKKYQQVTADKEYDGDPFLQIPSACRGPEEQFFTEEEPEDPRLIKLREFMQVLTDDQVNLIYDLCGNLKSLREIAEDTVKPDGTHPTEQAIYSREQKILKRLRKMFEQSEKQ